MTLWSVKKKTYLLETISVGYIDTVRHARDYNLFLIELCQEVVVKVSIKASSLTPDALSM